MNLIVVLGLLVSLLLVLIVMTILVVVHDLFICNCYYILYHILYPIILIAYCYKMNTKQKDLKNNNFQQIKKIISKNIDKFENK